MKHTPPNMFDTKHANKRLMRILQTMLLGMLICLTMPVKALDCTQNRWYVNTYAELAEAIECFNGKTGSSINASIHIRDDIVYTWYLPAINNPNAGARLQIRGIEGRQPKIKLDGSAFTLDGERALSLEGENVLTVVDLDVADFTLNGTLHGAALFNKMGTLRLVRVSVRQNRTDNRAAGVISFGDLYVADSFFEANLGVSGGAIHHAGADARLSIRNSTFHINRASESGGAIYVASSRTDNLISQSTFNQNQSVNSNGDGAGGAIHIGSGEITLTNNTIAGNTADAGGGLFLNLTAKVAATNNIIADNFHPAPSPLPGVPPLPATRNDCQRDSGATLTDDGHNLVHTLGNCLFDAATSVVGAEPLLNRLADNGGETQTMAPQAASPAIDAGDPSISSMTDQRGAARVLDGDLTDGNTPRVDIGAFEYDPQCRPDNTTWVVSDQRMYRAAIYCFNQQTDDRAYTIDVASDFEVNSRTLAVNDTTPNSAATLLIDGKKHTITAGAPSSDVFRLLVVESGSVTLQDIEMSGVRRSQSTGGAIYNAGHLTILKSYIHDNEITVVDKGGAGVLSEGGMLTIKQSTFARNLASVSEDYSAGGAVYVDGGALLVENSTFSGNQASTKGGAIAVPNFTRGITATLNHNTFVNNGTVGASADKKGAALYARYSDAVTMTNNVMAGSGTVAQCESEDGSLVVSSNNHIQDGSCGVSSSGDPLLDGLQLELGAFMPTHRPQSGSPLLDAVSSELTVDQLNKPRPQGALSDVGAFEVVQLAQNILNVTVTSAGGEVSASGATAASGAISACRRGDACAAGYLAAAPFETVTLTATADTGYGFIGWGGACSGTAPVSLEMSADKSCTATFVLENPDVFSDGFE